MADVTNPGLVNVADEAFGGLPNPDQAVKITSPASASEVNLRGGDGDEKGLIVVDQPVTVQVPGAPDVTFDGGLYHPGGVPVDVTQNNVDGQVYGVGTPANVYV